MMKKILFIVAIFLGICSMESQSYIYGDTIYYSDGSQYTNVSILLGNLDNISYINPLIEYNGITYKIPKNNNNNNNFSININPIKTNLSIIITGRKTQVNKWIVYYTIKNDYNSNVTVNISFPNGYNIKNISNLTIPKKSFKTIELTKTYYYSNNLYFSSSNISYILPEKISIIYMESIPFSIVKSNKIENNSIIWNGTYIIKNNKNKTLNIQGSFWVNINNTKFPIDNFSNITLLPYQNYTKSYNIVSNFVPIFYLKFNNTNKFYNNISILPALKYNNSYIVGIAKVEGVQLVDNTIWHNNNQPNNNNNNNQPNNDNNDNQPNNNRDNNNNNNQPNNDNNDNQPNNNRDNNEIVEKLKKYVLIDNRNKITIGGSITLGKPDNTNVSAVILAAYTFINIIVFFMCLISNLKPIIISDVKSPQKLINQLKLKNYSIYGQNNNLDLSKINYIIPINSQLTVDLHEILDIPLNQASVLEYAIKNDATIITEDIKLYTIAKYIGLNCKLI